MNEKAQVAEKKYFNGFSNLIFNADSGNSSGRTFICNDRRAVKVSNVKPRRQDIYDRKIENNIFDQPETKNSSEKFQTNFASSDRNQINL